MVRRDEPEVQDLVRVENLAVHFAFGGGGLRHREAGTLRAVDGVSIAIREGETLGLVGESGSGKTTMGRTILHLQRPTGGRVWFDGCDLSSLSPPRLRAMRRQMQMIFQDPFSSLDPRMTVSQILQQPLRIHRLTKPADRDTRVVELLRMVGLDPKLRNRYPHQFSGGQRQRVGIARALAVEPKFVVCDEPVSALDVSIQAQVINLLRDLQSRLNLTYLFIAHDLGVVRIISDRVAVMYLGKLMEVAPSELLYARPLHPYTQALMSAVPVPDPEIERQRQRIIVKGDIPSPANPPTGCRFSTRCWLRQKLGSPQRCSEEEPVLRELGSEQRVACHFAEELVSSPT